MVLKVKYEGYNVTISTQETIILEVWINRYSSNARNEKYISLLEEAVKNYINDSLEEPVIYKVGSLMNQTFLGRGKISFAYRPTGITVANCTLPFSSEIRNNLFIDKIIPIMEKYWLEMDMQ